MDQDVFRLRYRALALHLCWMLWCSIGTAYATQENAVVLAKTFGARGDGVSDDSRAIQLAIDSGRGRQVRVLLDGVHRCDRPLTVKGGVVLDGAEGTLRAQRVMLDFVTLESGARLVNTVVDANQLVTRFTVHASDFRDVAIQNNEVINWSYGIVAENVLSRKSEGLVISGNFVHSPGQSSIYPLWVNAKAGGTIRKVEIRGNFVEGMGGAYSPNTKATADQIELHGIEDAVVSNNTSIGGGEIGIVISRFSNNVLLENNLVSGSDKDGIEIGSGAVMLALRGEAKIQAGEMALGSQSRAKGKIETVIENNAYLINVSGQFRSGETLAIGRQNYKVAKVIRTRNITLSGNMTCNNGLDASKSGKIFAGIKLIQADDVMLYKNVATDTQTRKTQRFGAYAAHVSNITECSNFLQGNRIGDWSLNGTVTFVPKLEKGKLCDNQKINLPKVVKECSRALP